MTAIPSNSTGFDSRYCTGSVFQSHSPSAMLPLLNSMSARCPTCGKVCDLDGVVQSRAWQTPTPPVVPDSTNNPLVCSYTCEHVSPIQVRRRVAMQYYAADRIHLCEECGCVKNSNGVIIGRMSVTDLSTFLASNGRSRANAFSNNPEERYTLSLNIEELSIFIQCCNIVVRQGTQAHSLESSIIELSKKAEHGFASLSRYGGTPSSRSSSSSEPPMPAAEPLPEPVPRGIRHLRGQKKPKG